MSDTADAIVIENVVKSFRMSTIRREYTTFKSELVRWLRGSNKKQQPARLIEALRGIDLRIPKGHTVGILGRNGSGKSTLLKLITGIYGPTSGTIHVNGRISALLDLGAGFHPDFSGRENILINGIILGMSRAEVRARMDDIIAFSELGDFIDEPVRTYSSGMYARLAFSVATHVDPEILIVDEILAVGDQHFAKKSMEKMMDFKRQGKTIVIVTHDLGTVERWCDLAVWIDAGRVRRVGTPAVVAEEYKRAVAIAEERSAALGPAALAQDGGALPQVHGPSVAVQEQALTPRTGPQVSPQQRWGTFEVEVVRARFLHPSGEEAQGVDTEQPLDISIEYACQRTVSDVGFGIALFDGAGRLVYGTNTIVESVPLPSPLPATGSLRLSLKRLGLLPGTYSLDICAHRASGQEYDYHRGLYKLTVQSTVGDSGIVRPIHEWAVEPSAEAAPPALAANG
ncbi:ABC transporter ATP-binding protein [Myxococcaceae bacterium GXIMD 01537]